MARWRLWRDLFNPPMEILLLIRLFRSLNNKTVYLPLGCYRQSAFRFCPLLRMCALLVMFGSWRPICLWLIPVRSNHTSGSQISEDERTAVLLAGLSSEFDAIISSVSLSTSLLSFQRIIDALLKCEACQVRSAQEVLVAANVVEGSPLSPTDGPFHGGGRSSVRGRGRSFRLKV
ncbi:hypothetical protein V6Z11_A11G298000 [Gossypium hirsutum]